MKYLFDSSSVYALVKLDKPEMLAKNYTCSLARYEIGNILLTELGVRKVMGEAEQKSLLELILRALNVMLILNVNGKEQEIIDLAIKYNLSFYDASYVLSAKGNKATLVTEDQKLARKIKDYVSAVSVNELI